MKYLKLLLPVVVITVLSTSCEKEYNLPIISEFIDGVYIVNEGVFGQNNGSISYYDPVDSSVINNIFESANDRIVGDVVQSFAIIGDTAGCIVVNNSNKLEFVGLKTFRAIAAPLPVNYPRYFLPVSDDKGYLSAGNMQGSVYVIDINSFLVDDTIEVGYGPENMVLLNDRIYVANSGGWGVDSTISVINVLNNEVVSSIEVGKVPLDLALDVDDYLWVYCMGYAYGPVSGSDALLIKIDPETNNIIWQAKVGNAADYYPTLPKLAMSKDCNDIFYLRPDGVYKISARDPEIPSKPLIIGSFYGLDVDPVEGNVYAFESSFTCNGTMKVFSEDGTPVIQVTVGMAPNGAVFKDE